MTYFPTADVLRIEQLSKRFGARLAVNQVSWQASHGQIICLLGHSGCGKTTMLRLIAGLEAPTSGLIQLSNHILWSEEQSIPAEQRQIGLVFQDYALFPHLTVLENVKFGLKHLPKKQQEEVALSALAQVSMSTHTQSYPYTLSGGEQQRVALARALAPKPHIVLMDEPFSNLDHRLRDQIRNSTINTLKASRVTTVIVTHDPEEALQISDQIILMQDGQIVQMGTPQALYQHPNSLFAAQYFSMLNETLAEQKGTVLDTIFGRLDWSRQKQSFSTPHILCCFRPHHVSVETIDTPNSQAASIQKINFMGHAQQLELKLAVTKQMITAQVSSEKNFTLGQQVFISVEQKHLMFFEKNSNLIMTESHDHSVLQKEAINLT